MADKRSNTLQDVLVQALVDGVKANPTDTKMLMAAISYLKNHPPVEKLTKGSPAGILEEYLKTLPDFDDEEKRAN